MPHIAPPQCSQCTLPTAAWALSELSAAVTGAHSHNSAGGFLAKPSPGDWTVTAPVLSGGRPAASMAVAMSPGAGRTVAVLMVAD